MSNDDLMYILIQQLRENLIDKQELEILSEEGKEAMHQILSLRNM